MTYLSRFLDDTDGAVTVDWVVLTAALVGLQLVVMFTPIRESLAAVTTYISDTIVSVDNLSH